MTALDKSTQDGSKPTSDSSTQPTNLESDMTALAALLTQCPDDPPENDDDPHVAELLRRLTAADGVAKGVEERLDGIIENLDLLLTALERDPAKGQSPEANTPDKGAESKQSS